MHVIASLILWLVVVPLILILLLFAYRALHQRIEELKEERRTIEALKRIEENRRKTKESWKL